jgi:hypothetical protein
MADNLPPSNADVTEYGSLNLSEPSGSHRPVMALLHLFLLYTMNCATLTEVFPRFFLSCKASARV